MKAVIVLTDQGDGNIAAASLFNQARISGQQSTSQDVEKNTKEAGAGILTPSVNIWHLYDDLPEHIPDFGIPIESVRLLHISDPDLSETMLNVLEIACQNELPDILIFGSSLLDRELASRLAFRLGSQSCLGVEHILITASGLELTTTAYAGNLQARFQVQMGGVCISAAPKSKARLKRIPLNTFDFKILSNEDKAFPWLVSKQIIADQEEKHDENRLVSARFVLAAGMGTGSKDGIFSLKVVADKLGAVLGGTRPVVMNAWLPMANMIGVSGKIVSPELCITAGVSGSGAFARGVEESKYILAINSDPHALIFEWADAGIVEDLFEFLEELSNVVAANSQNHRESSGQENVQQ